MNSEQARINMVEQQVRPWEVLSQKVLTLFSTLPREDFVPEDKKALAYSDIRLPIGENQTMMHPSLEGRMLQALDVNENDTVLEIGTGSAFITVCLATLAKSVVSIDLFESFTSHAQRMLAAKNIENVSLKTGDALAEDTDKGQYSVVVISGSVSEVSDNLKNKLTVGGRMFAIVGSPDEPIMHAMLITRTSNNEWFEQSLFETFMAPLENSAKPKVFSL